jgi:hypothetical protein
MSVSDCLPSCRPQQLASILYAWAVLSCGIPESGASNQRVWAAAFFKEAAARDVTSFTQEGLGQLYAAHLYAQHLGIPGLPAGPVLEAARAAGWSKQGISANQREVASVLEQLGWTVRVEMKSPDGVMSADVGVTALPDGTPCSIAVELIGPTQYVVEHNHKGDGNNANSSSMLTGSNDDDTQRLDGPTRLRNALLHARFPDGVLCIPWRAWVEAEQGGTQQELLGQALGQALAVLE